MVKRVNVAFDNQEFEEFKKKKQQLGLSWPQIIRQGIECLLKERRQRGYKEE
ncbi:MAG: hypothetical protein F7C35_07180 [Desulfurococcales archaeon]|nr:hypothetical protein [Desulfurococcales archaeon]